VIERVLRGRDAIVNGDAAHLRYRQCAGLARSRAGRPGDPPQPVAAAPCANRLRERVARPCRERQNQDAYLEYSVGLAQLLNLGGRFEVRRWLQQL